MGITKYLQMEDYRKFNERWEEWFQEFPDMKTAAVRAMGRVVQKELATQIQASELAPSARMNVSSWQVLKFGSRGGYAAVRPHGAVAPNPSGRTKHNKYKGKPVTMRQVTMWLERGHGAQEPTAESWYDRERTALSCDDRGNFYVSGRQFYSRTKSNAHNLVMKEANDLMYKMADDLDRATWL